MENKATSDNWPRFPDTFRTEQVALIARWLAGGESGMIIGSSGAAGKSNLVGFLMNRPDVMATRIARQPERYCFLLLDINALPALTVPVFIAVYFKV
ncbi:MAG: hypothetical protein HS114_12975 [Anaerolineales bacterium]|nr:hypothetical protein [Anaerolineales bacterium]